MPHPAEELQVAKIGAQVPGSAETAAAALDAA
jgi:hypothetical protein